MGNIKNFNFNKLDLKLSNSDYWDFYLANDEGPAPYCGPLSEGDCFVVWYDFNNLNTYNNSTPTSIDGDNIYSLVSWSGAVNTGYTFNTIGLTGIDNGLVGFTKDPSDIANLALLSALTGTTLVIPSGDTRLHMNRVSGTTGNYVYPYDIIIDPNTPDIGNFASLYGGFYQGYYKLDGSNYEVLPTRVNQVWVAEFWLTTKQFGSPSGQTLNDTYPENEGFFFYMGTRAENKFWDRWVGADTGCTSACTSAITCTDIISEWCTVPKENEITLVGDYGIGISLDPPRTEIDLITNGFLIYGRAHDNRPDALTGTTIYTPTPTTITTYYCYSCGSSHDGLGTQTACSYDGKGIPVAQIRKNKTTDINPFLLYGRGSGIINSGDTIGCCGGPNDGLGSKTVSNFSGVNTPETSIDYNIDIIDNALGFRIKPDGSIGYRLLTVTGTCETTGIEKKYTSGTTITEEYSKPGLIDPVYWYNVVIKFETDYKSDCELKSLKPRKGKLKFYINGYLKFVVNDFSEFIAKRLDEYKSKQVGVPFNFSLGGGSQGLIESQTFGGLDLSDRGLPIEKNFGGTFMGGISQFKFNICDMSLCQIRKAYVAEAPKYGLQDNNLIIIEDNGFILQEDGYGINW
jgi:hypothetical protein